MNTNPEKKIILITGANSGIGKAAAMQLATAGAQVIMACRSQSRGSQAFADIRRASGSDDLELMLLDLSSQESIRRFVQDFQQRHARLDVLIHNAANFDLSMKKPILTEDGIETIFATNHVGPFLLTHLLLDSLRAAAPSRIITVASKGLVMHPWLDIQFDNLNGEKKFSPQHAYYQSKLAQLMFTYELAERLRDSGISANCVRVTNVSLPDERIAHLPLWMQKAYALKRKASITPEQQAAVYTFLAVDPSVEKNTGGYWDENLRQVHSSRNSYQPETRQRLWQVTEHMAGISITMRQ